MSHESDSDDVPLLIDTREVPVLDKIVPVTVVTGYLGSGKSTLLKYLTQHNAGKKIAIILNEFGDTADIERSLTVTQDNTEVEEWLELDNGCLCCTAKDAGVTAIEKLMERRGAFDYILLETTGIADPAPIASMFWLDDALNPSVQLDSIVAVVDGVNIKRSIETGETARVQLACADLVILNKCDLLDAAALAAAEQSIRNINSSAKIIRSQYGQVEADSIFDLKAYTSGKFEATTEAKHDLDISTVTIELRPTSEADFKEFERKLQLILWEHTFDGHDIEIHRTKARLCWGSECKIVQGVRETYDVFDGESEDKSSKLVFIGRGISDVAEALQGYFN